MSTLIDIDYQDTRWKTSFPATFIQALVADMSETLKLPGDFELSIVLGDDPFIHKLNHTYRGYDKPTDVLSFPQQRLNKKWPKDDQVVLLGDIILSYDTILKDAGTQGKTLQHHATHMIVHGFLHLLGYDHQTVEDALEMERLETLLLKGQNIKDPYKVI